MAKLNSPKVTVTFTELGITAIGRGEKGTVAVILRDATEHLPMTLTQASQIPEELGMENQRYLNRAFLGYVNPPKKVIGRNTADCMRSGIINGNAAALDGLIDMIQAELGHSCTLVSTGGLSKLVIPYCKHKIVVDDQLLLKGLMHLYDKNK